LGSSIGWEDRRAEDRRTGARRSADQIKADQIEAFDRAKIALLAHGLDSPEFAAAAQVTEDLRRELRELLGYRSDSI
jgi:hypothetical protein